MPYYKWINTELKDIIYNSLEYPEICKNKIISKEFIKKIIPKIKDSETSAMRGWMLYSIEEWYKKFII